MIGARKRHRCYSASAHTRFFVIEVSSPHASSHTSPYSDQVRTSSTSLVCGTWWWPVRMRRRSGRETVGFVSLFLLADCLEACKCSLKSFINVTVPFPPFLSTPFYPLTSLCHSSFPSLYSSFTGITSV